MAELRHEAVAQLLRDNDQLAPYLVVACGEKVPAGTARRADSDLSLIDHGLDMPGPPHRERRADVVTVINDSGKVCRVIISEPQSTEPDLDLAEPEVRKGMEEDMTLADLRVPFLDDPIDAAKAEGKTEGKAEGEVAMLLHIIKARGVALSDADRHLVESSADRTQLEYWAERALGAKSAFGTARPRATARQRWLMP